MTAIRNEAIGYINELSEEKLMGAIDYLRNLCEKKHPFEITSKEDLYSKIDEGLEDVQQGRVRPFKEAMTDMRKRIAER